MFQFIETICLLDGKLRNLTYHQARFENTRVVHFPDAPFISLEEAIEIPEDKKIGKFKVRVEYAKEITLIEIIPYQIKPIQKIALYHLDREITYGYKYADRWFFDLYLKETQCDDLVLVRANYITDTTYTNLIFFDGVEWHTPTTSLLNGTMQASLIDEGKIKKKNLKIRDLSKYYSFKRINAMMNFEEAQTFDIQILLQNL
ncbi:aminotransferase class IV [Faecalibacter rhinopitheci]|uniref:Aminotransferase class IV n=1 Tax=Faecalibacter rhinopitheci TaxID=2779678 RepID=A0A8J7G901_9FLAO|nr:aminotransferase class IV [Faecalibacter rhinopitheci]MBF0597605.1 aminotransferase class IV [Faecalibacter rhinopitheci]MBQ0148605.1 aminotransferase class IV [Candidatus Onthonaster equi]